jgi:hypothetical protein
MCHNFKLYFRFPKPAVEIAPSFSAAAFDLDQGGTYAPSVQTVALEIHELAIAVAVLVHSVETINTLTAQASIAATF